MVRDYLLYELINLSATESIKWGFGRCVVDTRLPYKPRPLQERLSFFISHLGVSMPSARSS